MKMLRLTAALAPDGHTNSTLSGKRESNNSEQLLHDDGDSGGTAEVAQKRVVI
jgi:hypothetical protein